MIHRVVRWYKGIPRAIYRSRVVSSFAILEETGNECVILITLVPAWIEIYGCKLHNLIGIVILV